jgi:hypothetical protein
MAKKADNTKQINNAAQVEDVAQVEDAAQVEDVTQVSNSTLAEILNSLARIETKLQTLDLQPTHRELEVFKVKTNKKK